MYLPHVDPHTPLWTPQSNTFCRKHLATTVRLRQVELTGKGKKRSENTRYINKGKGVTESLGTASPAKLSYKGYKVTKGLDLQPDGLTAGLAGHCLFERIVHFFALKTGCRKNEVAQTWLAYIPAGIVHVLRSHI